MKAAVEDTREARKLRNPEGEWETVTPKKAEAWLNLNTNNRKLRPGVAEKYADDMKKGRWLKNPEPIMFYDDGSLADGQHRLWAVVESGASVGFMVVRGVSKDVALNINTGIGRSLTDNARIAGAEPISHAIIAMAKIMEFGTHQTGKSLSNAARLELIEKHGAHLRWAEDHVSNKRYVGTAIVGAAIARAHAHETNLDRLAEFCVVLSTGMPKDPAQDSAGITIRNYLLEGGPARAASANSRDTFLKSMNAIRYFMRRRPLTVIKGVKDEAYPL